jgi:hypothetical protein
LNLYRVTAGYVTIQSGILGLNPPQAAARRHRLTPLGDGRYDVTRPPVGFKRGEYFRLEGELPKALWRSVEAYGRRPGALKAQTRNATKRRWVKRNEAREWVLRDWEKNPSRFPSAAQAARHYTERLAEQGYQFEARTVRDWILDRAKKLGMK